MAKKIISKTKGKAMTSPKGGALWTKIITPDTEYDRNGTYETSLVLDPNDDTVKGFIANLENLLGEAVAEAKENLAPEKAEKLEIFPITRDEVDADKNPTGNIIVKAKLKAKDHEFKDQKVDVYDVKGRKENDWDTDIGNGSTIKVKVFAFPYYMAKDNTVGVSMKLNKLQLINLVEYEGDGFGDESGEEGFGDDEETFDGNKDDDF